MQTSVTVEKSVLLSGANIIAAQRFTAPEWRVLASIIGMTIVHTSLPKQQSCMATSMRNTCQSQPHSGAFPSYP